MMRTLKETALVRYEGEAVNDPMLRELIEACQTDDDVMALANEFPMPFISYSLLENPGDELIKKAIDDNPFAFRGVVNPSDEVVDYALSLSGENIRFVIQERQTTERCMMAISQNPFAIKGVVAPTVEMCVMACDLNAGVFDFIPDNMKALVNQ